MNAKITSDDIQYINNWTNTPVPYCASLIMQNFTLCYVLRNTGCFCEVQRGERRIACPQSPGLCFPPSGSTVIMVTREWES